MDFMKEKEKERWCKFKDVDSMTEREKKKWCKVKDWCQYLDNGQWTTLIKCIKEKQDFDVSIEEKEKIADYPPWVERMLLSDLGWVYDESNGPSGLDDGSDRRYWESPTGKAPWDEGYDEEWKEAMKIISEHKHYKTDVIVVRPKGGNEGKR